MPIPVSKDTVCRSTCHANSSVKGHCMQVHMLMEPMPGPQLPTVVVTMVTHSELHSGSSRVPICLCNISAHSMEIPTKKTVVGQVATAKQVPPVVLPTRTSEESSDKPQKGWTESCCSNGNTCLPTVTWTWTKTSLIKHKIGVMDWTPFKEHYQCIPPNMYNDMRVHI